MLCTGLLLGLLLFITLLVLVTGWMVLGHGREFLIGPEGVRELSLALGRLTHA